MMPKTFLLFSAVFLVFSFMLSGFSGCSKNTQTPTAAEKKPSGQPAQPAKTPPPASSTSSTKTTQPSQTIAPSPDKSIASEFLAQMDEKARVVMTAAAQAYGGFTHPLDVRDLVIKAKTSGPTPFSAQPITLEMAIYLKGTDKLKTVTTGLIPGQQMVMGYDGKSGWMQLVTIADKKVTRTQDLPAQQLQELRTQMVQNVTRVNNPFFEALRLPTYAFKFVETSTLEKKSVDVIEVTLPDGKATKIFIDQSTHDVLKSEQVTSKEKTETLFGDYRVLSERRIPFAVKTLVNGKPAAEMQVEDIQINSGLEDALFAKQESK